MYDNEDKQWLYGKFVDAGLDIGTYEGFDHSLQNDEDKKWYYEKATGMGLDVGTYDEFDKVFGKKPRQTKPSNKEYPITDIRNPQNPMHQPDEFTPPEGMDWETNPAPATEAKPARRRRLVDYILGNAGSTSEQVAETSQPELRYKSDANGDLPQALKDAGLTAKDVQFQWGGGQSGAGYYTLTPEQKQKVDNAYAQKILNEGYEKKIRKDYGVQIDEAMSDADKYKTQLDEMSSRVPEIPAAPGAIVSPKQATLMANKDYVRLQQAYTDALERAHKLEMMRDGTINSFWANAGDALLSPEKWTFGLASIYKAGILADAMKDQDDLTSQETLSQALLRNETEAEFFHNQSNKGRWGTMTGEMARFMLLNAAGSGLFEKTGKAVEGAIRGASESLGRKFLGKMANDLTLAALTANTVGAANTIAEALQNKQGFLTQKEDGSYAFEDGQGWWKSIWNAEANQITEYFTERLGEHFGPAGQRVAEKLGLKAVSDFITREPVYGFEKGIRNFFKAAGVNHYPGEVLEEEAGIILSNLLQWQNPVTNVKNAVHDLFDGKQQADIWGGMAFSIGLMQAVPISLNVASRGYNHYYGNRLNHRLNSADKEGEAAFGDGWNALRDRIDNTVNEDISPLVYEIAQTPETQMSTEQKRTALNYIDGLLRLRGFTTGTMSEMQRQMMKGREDAANDLLGRYGKFWMDEELVYGDKKEERRPLQFARRVSFGDQTGFVVGEDNGDLLVNVGGQARIVKEDALTEDTGRVPLFVILDERNQEMMAALEQERMRIESQNNANNLAQRAIPGATVEVGAEESKEQATIIGQENGDYILQKTDGTILRYSPKQMADAFGLPYEVKSNDQLAEIDAKVDELTNLFDQKIGNTYVFNRLGGVRGEIVNARAFSDQDGSIKVELEIRDESGASNTQTIDAETAEQIISDIDGDTADQINTKIEKGATLNVQFEDGTTAQYQYVRSGVQDGETIIVGRGADGEEVDLLPDMVTNFNDLMGNATDVEGKPVPVAEEPKPVEEQKQIFDDPVANSLGIGEEFVYETKDGRRVVNSTELWNKNPELWAKWNDQNTNRITPTIDYLSSKAKVLDDTVATKRKELDAANTSGADQGTLEDLQEELRGLVERQGRVRQLYDSYVAAEEAAKEQPAPVEEARPAEPAVPAPAVAENPTPEITPVQREALNTIGTTPKQAAMDVAQAKLDDIAKRNTADLPRTRKVELMREKAGVLQEMFNQIGEENTTVSTREDILEQYKRDGGSNRAAALIEYQLNKTAKKGQKLRGFYSNGKIYLIADDIVSTGDANLTNVHEGKHLENTTTNAPQESLKTGITKQEMADAVYRLTGSDSYSDFDEVTLADEILANAAEIAERSGVDNVPETLRAAGITNEDFINFVTNNIENGRRGQYLPESRRDSLQPNDSEVDRGQDVRNPETGSGALEGQLGSSGGSRPSVGAGEAVESPAAETPDENGVTPAQRTEITAAVGGEMEKGPATKYSVTAIAEGAGLEAIGSDDNGNVVFIGPDGKRFTGKDTITADYLKSLPNTVMGYMMADAKRIGTVTGASEGILWQKYADMLNAFLQKGLAENGGIDNLATQWQWIAETVYKTVASNSDAQYSYSLDITRVCKKNEAVIKTIAEVQRRLGRGVTPAEIMEIYLASEREGYQVPCPVCYVFSRYIRNGQYATIMINGQKKYGSRLRDPRTMTEAEKEAAIKYWRSELDKQQKNNARNKKAVTKAKADIQTTLDEIDKLGRRLLLGIDKGTKAEDTVMKIYDLDERYRAALQVVSQAGLDGWITNFAIHEVNGKWELYDDTFQGFPEEMALDLRETATVLREFPAIQRYRNSRGAAAGKEITFEANNDLGEVPMMLGVSDLKDAPNYYKLAVQATDPEVRDEMLKKARERFTKSHIYAQRQSLRGGQRMWSWSDNIERLSPDVFVNLMQMEMLGGALQSYSKQLEGINLVARMGGYVNGSLMGKGIGYREVDASEVERDGDALYVKGGDLVLPNDVVIKAPVFESEGKYYTLEFDDVVGIDAYGKDENGHHYKGLFELNLTLDKAGNILVGMNDLHVRAAMADRRVFFIIPWHSSGGSVHLLKQMLNYLGVDLTDFKPEDYTNVQEEKAATNSKGKVNPRIVAFWEAHKNETDFPVGISGGIPSGKDGKLSPQQIHYKELRDAIFVGIKEDTGKLNKDGKPIYKNVPVEKNPAWMREIMKDEFLSQTYAKVHAAVDNGMMTSGDTKYIYPYEYWDESSTYDTADVNGARYLEYCRRLGYKPKFVGKLDGKPENDFGNFADDRGYWKLLIDRRMYDTQGRFQDLTPISTEGFTTDLVDPEKTAQEFKVTRVADDEAAKVVADRMLDRESARPGGVATVNYDSTLDTAVKNYEAVLNKKPTIPTDAQREDLRRFLGNLEEDFGDSGLRLSVVDDGEYLSAIEGGDMKKAQKFVDEAANKAGYTVKAFHGTKAQFTSFRYNPDDIGFHFGDKKTARSRVGRGKGTTVMPVYLKIENPLEFNEDLGSWDGEYIARYLLENNLISEEDARSIMLTPKGYRRDSREQTTRMREWLISNGYDSIKYPNWYESDGSTSYIVLQRSNVKSAETVTRDNEGNVIPPSKRFSEDNGDIRFSIANTNNEIFVSNAQKAVEGIKMEKATPEQWLKMIEKGGGLKAGEDKWIGLSDWLRSSDRKSLTKQEVSDFIEQNRIRIEEVNYAEEEERDYADAITSYQDEYAELVEKAKNNNKKAPYEFAYDEMADLYGERFFEAFNRDGETITPSTVWAGDDSLSNDAIYFLDMRKEGETKGINPTRLNYTTEGLKDKREIALTVPTIEPWNQNDNIHFGDAGEGRAVAWIRFGDATVSSAKNAAEAAYRKADKAWRDYRNEIVNKYALQATGTKTTKDLATPEENARVHELRMESDRLYHEWQYGRHPKEKVLVIDEIQSKRHQEGREKGYADKNSIIIKREEKGWSYSYTDSNDSGFVSDLIAPTEEDARNHAAKLHRGSVPSAPFEKNWHELAMKRMLRLAAEEGYDYVAWTTGEQQAERYDIGTLVKDLEATESYREDAYKDIYANGEHIASVSQDGTILGGDNAGKPLSELVGKELAVKLMADGKVSLSGESLRIGGEGMKGFYDDILPRFMNKYGKKWGTKVEDLFIPNIGEDASAGIAKGLTMHAVPVTEEMKESVMEGQPMFSIHGREVQYPESVTQEQRDAVEKNLTDYTNIESDRYKQAKKLAEDVVSRIESENEEKFGDTRREVERIDARLKELNSEKGRIFSENLSRENLPTLKAEEQTLKAQRTALQSTIKSVNPFSFEAKKQKDKAILDAGILDNSEWKAVAVVPSFEPDVREELMRMGWHGQDNTAYATEYGFVSHWLSHHPDMTETEVSADMLKNLYNPTVVGFDPRYEDTILFIRNGGGTWYTTAIKVNPFKNDGSLLFATTYKNKENPSKKLARTISLGHLKGAAASNQIHRSFDDHAANIGINSESAIDSAENLRENGGATFSIVADQDKINELDAGNKVKVYRSMQLIDGELYPPMSAKVGGELREPSLLGSWEQSEEHPELADKDGNFKLDKGNGNSLKAAYAPYFHSRLSPLNEQFSEAYNRPNLVIVEGEIPESELTSGYIAEGSKKSVGEHDWASGKVSNALAKQGDDTRKVILSRWFKPVRIVTNSEVADIIANKIGQQDITFPYNTVTPGLREELRKRGVRFEGWQGNKPKNVDEIIAGMKRSDNVIDYLFNGADSISGENDAKFSITAEDSQKLFDAAKERFGVTKNIKEAGYVLPDGAMLDFSGRHWSSGDTSWMNGLRQVDHRDISELEFEKDGNTPSGLKTDMSDFIRRGAIRIDSSGSINLATKPTAAQESVLRRLIESGKGYVWVDFGDGNTSDHSVSYDNIRPERIINDIRRYFNEGVKPESRALFSVVSAEEDAEYMEAANSGDEKRAQELVDKAAEKAGYTIKAFHGGPYRFNTFDRNRLGQTTDAPSAREGFFFTDDEDLANDFAQMSLKNTDWDEIRERIYEGLSTSTQDAVNEYYDLYKEGDPDYQDYLSDSEDEGATLSDEGFLQNRGLLDDGKSIDDAKREYIESIIERNVEDGLYDEWEEVQKELRGLGIELGHTQPVYLKLENPLIDNNERDYFLGGAQIDEPMTEVIRKAKRDGHDGVIFTDIREGGQGDYATQYVIFNESQAKSRDTIERDDDGNIIPLSERFNDANDDIRFSLRGVIGAQNDETAMQNLEIAKEMEKAGKDATTIWAATGWEKGVDGKWRNEIKDATPKVIAKNKRTFTVGDVVDAPELFKSYPEIKDYKVTFKKLKGAVGQFTRENKAVTIDPDYGLDYKLTTEQMEGINKSVVEYIRSEGVTSNRKAIAYKEKLLKETADGRALTDDGLDCVLHELQHAIQYIEGFARGGNTNNERIYIFREAIANDPITGSFALFYGQANDPNKLVRFGKNAMVASIKNNLSRFGEQEQKLLEDLSDYLSSCTQEEYIELVRESDRIAKEAKANAPKNYHNLAGEVEARNVQARHDMSDEDRAAIPPSETEGVPRSEQGVRFSIKENDDRFREAVESGDTKTVRDMVMAAVKEAMPNTKVVDRKGNPKVVYHGTVAETPFRVFNDRDIYMVSKNYHAEQYTHRRGMISVSPAISGRVMPVFVNLENPLIMDANRRLWRNLIAPWPQDGVVTTEDVAKYARENGYDGVIIKNVRDNMFDDDRTYADDIIAFDSSQVKSAGPVYERIKNWHFPWEMYDNVVEEVGATYDENGDLIPLSERFNGRKSDINFSIRGDAEDLRRFNKEGLAGVIGEENVAPLMRSVYAAIPKSVKAPIVDKALTGMDFRGPLNEYLHDLAAKGTENDETGLLRAMYDEIRALAGNPELTDGDIRYMIWKSTGESNGDILSMAEDIAMKNRWNVGKDEPRYSVRKQDLTEVVEDSQEKLDEKTTAAAEKLKTVAEAVPHMSDLLNPIVTSMAAQKEYDRATVDGIVDFAKQVLKNGGVSTLTTREFNRLLTIIKSSTGKSPKSVTKYSDELLDKLIDHMVKDEQAKFDKLINVKDVRLNQSGVAAVGSLDVSGQITMRALRDYMFRPQEEIDNRIAEVENKFDSSDKKTREDARAEFEGLKFASDYQRDLAANIKEGNDLENGLDEAKDAMRTGDFSRKDYAEFAKVTEQQIRENKIARVDLYRDFKERLSELQKGSKNRAHAFREAERERVERIHHLANLDMQGTPNKEHLESSWKSRALNSTGVRFFLKPLATFDQMLRLFGRSTLTGEGFLYNHFGRGWIDAREKELIGKEEAIAELDKKVKEIFDDPKMQWSKLYDKERKMKGATVYFFDGGEKVAHDLTPGNLLYIYMANKMVDGKMKLRRMGISEEDVQAIQRNLDPEFIELADWIQSEFLPKRRAKYNAVHEEMFGASMAAIDDYFPLKILSNARVENIDLADDPGASGLTSTTTGSIIKRQKNSLALDLLNTDAFNLVVEHVEEMENWAAFAKLRRDMNTLLSYKRFRNQVQNMDTVYGSGKVLWDNFRDVASVAMGNYRPKVGKQDIDTLALNVAKGVTGAKISFRIGTALKQFLSAPAFLSDARLDDLVKNLATAPKAWTWCMENLPIFRERWNSRFAGDTRLMKTESDWKLWKTKLVREAGKLGMSPNAFVDALTVAVGAKSMYDTNYRRYIDGGYSEEEADRKAKQDATILYNQTQQSSEAMFTSAMQLDRTLGSVMLTVFRNSSMGYNRQTHDALRIYGRMMQDGYKERAIERMTRQRMEDGLSEDEAKAFAEKEYNRQYWRSAARIGVFAFLLPLAWNYGIGDLLYLLFGDDDKEKEKIHHDALMHTLAGPVEGLTAGSVISSAWGTYSSTGKTENISLAELPIESDMAKILSMVDYDAPAAVAEIVNLIVQSGIGVNPQTFTDAIVATIDAFEGDMGTAKEFAIWLMRVNQLPQPSIERFLVDEFEMTPDEAKAARLEDLAKRYADYKMRKGAISTLWMYDPELEEKRRKSYEKKFKKKVTDRENLHVEDQENN